MNPIKERIRAQSRYPTRSCLSVDLSCERTNDENSPPVLRRYSDNKPKDVKPVRQPKKQILSSSNSCTDTYSEARPNQNSLEKSISLPIVAKPKTPLNLDAVVLPPVVFPLPKIPRLKNDSKWLTTSPIYVADSRVAGPFDFPSRKRHLFCFICGTEDDSIIKCSTSSCTVKFHEACARKYTGGGYTFNFMQRNKGIHCSRHHCAQCFADHNRVRCFNGDMISCSQCELSWHTDCIPGGCVPNSKKEIVCPRHISFSNPPHLHILHCADCQQKPADDEKLVKCNNCLRSLHFKCYKESSHFEVGDDSLELREKAICNWCNGFDFVRYGQYCMARLGATKWYPCKIVSNKDYPKEDIVPMSEADYFFVSEAKKMDIFEEWEEAQEEVIKDSPENSIPKPNQINPNYSNGELVRKIMKCKYSTQETRPSKDFQKNFDLCQCKPGAADRCGPSSNCINRALRVECPQECELVDGNCNNRALSSGKNCVKVAIKPSRSTARYFGAFSEEEIPAHGFVGEYVGEIITHAEKERRIERISKLNSIEAQYYIMDLDHNRAIDAHYYGNNMRYVNHSCEPNCAVQVITSDTDDHIVLVALRTIRKGEELSFDYNMYSITTGRSVPRCLCNAKNCTGILSAQRIAKSKKSSVSSVSVSSANSKARLIALPAATSKTFNREENSDDCSSRKRGRQDKKQDQETPDQSRKLRRPTNKQQRLKAIAENDS
ncbi:SET domain-containing protein [Ditylenchus destructor]|nr:SET domain-containing protein [Ditylenchus destructor]